MITMNKRIIGVAMTVLLFAACTKDEEGLKLPSSAKMICAYTNDSKSRTYYEELDGRMIHKWQTDDNIGVFDRSTAVSEYLLIDGADSEEGIFLQVSTPESGSALNQAYAIYPFSANNKITAEGVFNVVYPEMQTYSEDHKTSYGHGSNMLVATSDSSESFSFKNACGFLEIKLLGEGITVKNIVLEGNKSERIAGNAIISYKGPTDPKTTMLSTATTSVTLDCGDGVQLDGTTPTTFVLALPPTKFSEGFSIQINEVGGRSIGMMTNKEVDLLRNIVLPMKVLDYYDLPIIFADTNFKQSVVEQFDTNNDTAISLREALCINVLDVSSKEICSLDGIQYLTNLHTLNCSNNQLTEIDLSNNTQLKKVDMTANPNLSKVTIWTISDYVGTYLDYDPTVLTAIEDKDGNNYGRPYMLGQYIPLHSGGIVAYLDDAQVVLLSPSRQYVSYSKRNSEEVTLWKEKYGPSWGIPSYEMWYREIYPNRVVVSAALNKYGIPLDYYKLALGGEVPYWSDSSTTWGAITKPTSFNSTVDIRLSKIININ